MARPPDNPVARRFVVLIGSWVRIQDATGAERLVQRSRTPDARTWRGYRRLAMVSLVVALIVLIAGAVRHHGVDAWLLAAAGAWFLFILLMGVMTTIPADPGKHIRSWLSRGVCPWCFSVLRKPDDDDKRRCAACHGEWWDVPGVQPGLSARMQASNALALNIAAALLGLFVGFMLFGITTSGPWKDRMIGDAVLAIICLCIFVPMGWGGVSWKIAAGAVWSIPSILGVLWLRGAEPTAGLGLIGAGLLAGTLTGFGAAWGGRRRRRNVRLGHGRLCAQCGYDLRAAGAGRPCPECGSRFRVR